MNIDSSRIVLQPVQVTFLEMHERPVNTTPAAFNMHFELLPKPVEVSEYRSYYYGVGKQWYWLDRMVMDDALLYAKINAPNVDIFVLYIEDQTAGFAEFVREKEYVEILYFGLLPGFIGKGYGNYFLQTVIQQAWDYAPQHIQLNTCTLDHPNALSIYKKAGFQQVRTSTEERRILK
ncbi:GNAT family N-acetyltransferase [Pseudoflavitalea sp. X16]|uniref:GNAT family N-acetyltransferase n=1 Tax=Paraflavitalea devenefica TaxID=2716334 RepID=UPI001421EFAD|nr:GNAT family N-acetyltransferase [Paraflavitalea devenefica]NII27463.1 GNAT family N-acetyltransferase [Paraflavitalea devenefica]